MTTATYLDPQLPLSPEQWIVLLGFVPSDEQQAAITAPLAPARIVAGAGTGKTTVMAARVGWLIATGQVTPESVLGLTFTTKAAAELASRVRSLLPGVARLVGQDPHAPALDVPTISTYNAFGARLLREHALRIGIEPDSRVVVDALRFQLGYRVIANTAADLGAVGYTPTTALTDMLKLDQALASYLIDPEAVITGEAQLVAKYDDSEAGDIQQRMVAASRKRQALAQVVAEYRTAKIDHDLIDYSDQIRLAAHAARTSPTMRAMLREQYSVVLLDEYQDTSVAQKELLAQLFADGFPVMAVGDPCQAIYRWRGAEIGNMDRFPQDFPVSQAGQLVPAATYPLTVNRRSSPDILAAANTASVPLRAIHDSVGELVPGRPDLPAARIDVGLFETFADEVSWITRELLAIGQSVPWEDMAVLMREKKNIATLVRSLEDAGIPVQMADPGALFALPEVREVISYLQIVADPTANTALVRILAGPRWRIGAPDLKVLGEHASHLASDRTSTSALPIDVQLEHIVASTDRAERVCLLDAMELVSDSSTGYSRDAVVRLKAVSAELRELRGHLGEPLPELVARIVRVTGLGAEALTRTLANGSTRYDRLAMLLDVVSGFRDVDGRMSVEAFLAFVADNDRFGESVGAELPLTRQAVTVMSMHKAKGLEYPVVALPGWNKGVFPSTVADDYWPHNAHVVPPHYTGIDDDPILLEFPAAADHIDDDFEAHKAHVRGLGVLDERRLAYVALTRAQHTVLASGSWWGPTQSRKREPSIFLTELRQHATHEEIWFADPGRGAANPALVARVHPEWPASGLAVRGALEQQAAFVVEQPDGELTREELSLVASWDADIAAVLEQARAATAQTRVVRLPATLSASQLISLQSDRRRFLETLVRPMPAQPSAAADRGTAFHAWLETFYGQRGMFEPDSLPGSGDDSIYSDELLERLKESFTRGAFAERTPAHMEMPFALVIAGRTVRGRIDAIFAGDESSDSARRWLVVDWKTGAVGSADPLQLHIYRHAWAHITGCSPDDVEAAFHYVSENETVFVPTTMTLEEIAVALTEAQ